MKINLRKNKKKFIFQNGEKTISCMYVSSSSQILLLYTHFGTLYYACMPLLDYRYGYHVVVYL